MEDGTRLQILVNRQDGSSETWELTVRIDAEANVNAVTDLIQALPEVEALRLSDAQAVEAARNAYDRLSQEEKEKIQNYDKLQQAEAKLQELREAGEAETNAAREEMKKKIQELTAEVRIANKNTAQQYLKEMKAMEEWEESEALREKLEAYLAEIEELEKAASQLNQDIWDQIDPLRISQEDADTVKALMSRYAVMTEEQQGLLTNQQSLLVAADVIASLEEGILPAKIFANMMSTKEDFTYYGTTDSGLAYTLTYDAESVTKAEDINAKVTVTQDSEVENAEAEIEFAQKGSMNGNVTFSCSLSVSNKSYQVYFFDEDSLSVKTAGTAAVTLNVLELTVFRGGRYWISGVPITLEKGTTILPEIPGTDSPSGTIEEGITVKGTKERSSSVKNTQTGAGSTTAASGNTRQTSASTSSSSKKSSTESSTESSKTIKAETENGVIKKSEFQKIEGKDQNLQAEGTFDDKFSYTITFHGEDVKEPADFYYLIQNQDDCENAADIRQLAEDPLILCMEKSGKFPGKALLSVKTEKEDGTYLLFRYNSEEKKAEYVKKAEIKNGTSEFTLEEGADYFLAKRAKAGSLIEETKVQTSAAQTAEDDTEDWDSEEELMVMGTDESDAGKSDFGKTAGIAAGIAAAAVCAGAIGFSLKKRRKKGAEANEEI